MSQMLDIHAPSEQEGTRSRLLRWLKKPGEPVTQNEPLIELETDKVTVEVAAPGSGVLAELLRQEGDELEPGELLGRIQSSAVSRHPRERGGPVAEVSAELDSRLRGNDGAVNASDSAVASDKAVNASDSAVASDKAVNASDRVVNAPSGLDAPLSPAVRRLLAEHKLEASAIQGSGEGGRITVGDVLRQVSAGSSAIEPLVPAGGGVVEPRAPAKSSGAGAALVPAESSGAGAVLVTGRLVPHSPMRMRVAEHMVQSLLRTAPHVTSVFEADMSAAIAHRARHRQDFAQRGAPLTFTAYFLAAAVKAIRAVPESNSRWTPSALEIFDRIDIGVATALEQGGLVVPVLRQVESRDLFDIAMGLNDLVTRARENRLTPADMRGGTFTISNHGVSGSLIAAPIVIHQPQSAILGIGKMEKRAVVMEEDGKEQIVVRPRCYVTLTIDHRVMDGLQANRFLQTFVAALETGLSLD